MSVTVHDLARLSGMNASTISRALRGDPRVKAETGERIRALARENGYVPNLTARNLADGRTRMIAFPVCSIDSPMERHPANALNLLLARKNYNLMILLHNNQSGLFGGLLEKFAQKMCDGVILIPPPESALTQEQKKRLKNLTIPLVFLDRWLEGYPFPVVTTDNALAVRTVMSRLIDAGADGIFSSFDRENPVSSCRKNAVEKECAKHRISLFDSWNALSDAWKNGIIRRPAVFANSADTLRNISAPDSMKWLGACFDGFELERPTGCSGIIYAVQDFSAIAEKSAGLLFRMLNGETIPSGTKILIPPLEIKEKKFERT